MENAMRMCTTSMAAAFLALGVLSSSPVSAEILLAKAMTNAYDVPDEPIPAPLDDAGRTFLTFNATKKGVVVITYNAECAAVGPVGLFVGLQILVDGKPTNPKAPVDEFAFCTASGETEIFTAVSRQAFINVKEGSHIVEVLIFRFGVESGRIDDSSIVIFD
jgi:hypothetical protein